MKGGVQSRHLLRIRYAHHLLVSGETVVIARVLAAAVLHIVQHLAGQLDVVVGELANFGVVDAEDLGLLGGAQREARDQVHDEEDDAGAAERVDAARDRVRQLVAQLDPVVVEPAAGDLGEAVEVRDVVGREEGREDVADQTADGVLGEDVQRVVDANHELQLGGVVGTCRPDDAVDHGGPGRHESGTGGDGDQARNNARAEADG